MALGNAQTHSKSKQDRLESDRTFAAALKFCANIGGDFDKSNRAACYAFRAKSKFAQGFLADSETDFAKALSLINSSNRNIEIDILYDRAALRIEERRFADAIVDVVAASKNYDAMPLTLDTIEQKVMNQLDRNSVYSRSDVMLNIEKGLSKLEAKSSDEALQMVLLSNLLAERMGKCKLRSAAEVRAALKFSASQLSKIDGHEQLKKETLALLAAT